jgi:hypothetical protein
LVYVINEQKIVRQYYNQWAKQKSLGLIF